MSRLILLFLVTSLVVCTAQPVTTLTCAASAVPAIVRAEGLAERAGDVVLNCSGGVPGGTVTANLIAFTTVNVTNKLSSSNTLDVFLTVDTGTGPRSAGASAMPAGTGSVTFNGMSFNLSPTGTATLRITNLRLAASQGQERPITVALATSGPTSMIIQNSPQTVAIPQRGLLGNYSSTFVCTISPLPDTVAFSNLLAAGTKFASIRLTEATAEAFALRAANSDNGTRFVARFNNFPPGARLFVPEAVAGSNATQPTAGGDLGLPPSGGSHTPGMNSLLLVRVRGAARDGSAGSLSYTPGPPGSGTVKFDAVAEVELTGGSGQVAYEVVDASAAARESAQFPVFLALSSRPEGGSTRADVAVSFGPVSNDASASASAPVPRFLGSAPPSDCSALGDCTASYLPQLEVSAAAPLQFTAISGSAFQTKYVQIRNGGGGVLNWSAVVGYQTGSGWVRLDPEYGLNNGTVRVDVIPTRLSAGRYDAMLTIDAGPLAGSRTLPIGLTVTELPPIQPPQVQPPEIRSVSNAADGNITLLVSGSLASVYGSRFSGSSVEVTFDGTAARILYRDDQQINIEVPASLGTRTSSQLLLIVDGRTSAPRTVPVVLTAPAVFRGGVLNQDNTPNAAGNPALAGSVIQIFLTGLPSSAITARIADREFISLQYAGAAPGLSGVQQVNLALPEDAAAGTVELRVCGFGVCSPAVQLHIRR